MKRHHDFAALLVACAALSACSAPSLPETDALDGADTSGGASASCAGPYAETSPRQAQPGERLTVVGEYYLDGCYDTGQARRAQPLEDLLVTFTQGAAAVEYGRHDAVGPNGTLQTYITVPTEAKPGLAQVTVGSGAPALVLIGDGNGGYPPWPGRPKGPFELSVVLTQVPTYPEGGYIIASATTVDFQVPDADKKATVVEPLAVSEVSFGKLVPTYWMVRVSVYRCPRDGCAAPDSLAAEQAEGCEMEARIYDRPVRMIYRHAALGGTCDLQSA